MSIWLIFSFEFGKSGSDVFEMPEIWEIIGGCSDCGFCAHGDV